MRALLLCSTLLALMQGFLAASALAGEVVKVSIGDLAFAPANITVHVGDTIEWDNTDFVDHTATAKNGDWDVADCGRQDWPHGTAPRRNDSLLLPLSSHT